MIKFLTNRFFHIFILIIAVLLVLTSFLHKLAVTEHEKYSALSLEQRIRKVEIPAGRGEILDSEGNVLAKNEIGYSIKLNYSFIPSDSFSDQCIKMYDFFRIAAKSNRNFQSISKMGFTSTASMRISGTGL